MCRNNEYYFLKILYCYKKRHFHNFKTYGMMVRKTSHKSHNDDWDTDLIEDEREQQNQVENVIFIIFQNSYNFLLCSTGFLTPIVKFCI